MKIPKRKFENRAYPRIAADNKLSGLWCLEWTLDRFGNFGSCMWEIGPNFGASN